MTENCGANIENIEDLKDFYQRFLSFGQNTEMQTP